MNEKIEKEINAIKKQITANSEIRIMPINTATIETIVKEDMQTIVTATMGTTTTVTDITDKLKIATDTINDQGPQAMTNGNIDKRPQDDAYRNTTTDATIRHATIDET